jgi:hypothetical protein
MKGLIKYVRKIMNNNTLKTWPIFGYHWIDQW